MSTELVKRAAAFVRLNNLELALNDALAAKQLNPDSFEATYMLGKVYMEAKDYAKVNSPAIFLFPN